jgi:uncharacterized protein YbjT (DUF2867 family)
MKILVVGSTGVLGRPVVRRLLEQGHNVRAMTQRPDRARAAGVQRFVYTSALGATATHAVDFFRTKHAIEAHLQASGLAHVILRPTAFMEQHVHDFNGKGLLDKGRIQLIGPGTKLRNYVAGDDVARFPALAPDHAGGVRAGSCRRDCGMTWR